MKAINFVLVYFSDTPQSVKLPYLRGLVLARQEISAWLLKYNLMVPSWNIQEAAFAVPGSVYNEKQWMLTQHLIAKGTVKFDGATAWYLFPSTCQMGGTLGGDVFGQKNGQEANRVPGVSFFGKIGLRALAYGKEGSWTKNMACGAIAHELMHSIGLLPDQKDSIHASNCVMTSGLYGFPNCVLETNGGIFGGIKGDEIAALARYGFVRRC